MNMQILNAIGKSKNICLIPSHEEPESIPAALALFYTLRELGKNVNLIVDTIPERLNFLIPSTDFVTSPKHFVVSIPRNIADISQIYYEKSEENLKIYLTVDKGSIKKEYLSCYFSEPKPDLVITLGIKDLHRQLTHQLESFGFLLGSPTINIDSLNINEGNDFQNMRFGTINVVEERSLSEIALGIIRSLIGEDSLSPQIANCLLTGIIMRYKNFTSPQTNPETLEVAARLMRQGGTQQRIVENLYKTGEDELSYINKILQYMKREGDILAAIIKVEELGSFHEEQLHAATEKVKTLGLGCDILVIWKGHDLPSTVKGMFYSRKPSVIKKIVDHYRGYARNEWALISVNGDDAEQVKKDILIIASKNIQ